MGGPFAGEEVLPAGAGPQLTRGGGTSRAPGVGFPPGAGGRPPPPLAPPPPPPPPQGPPRGGGRGAVRPWMEAMTPSLAHPRNRPPAHRLRPRPRLHGHVGVLPAPPTSRAGDRHDPPGPRPRRHVPRHRRHVRPVHQRAAGRQGHRRPPRRGPLATKFGNERRADGTLVGINGHPDYVRAPATPRCSASASTTSTSTTSTASTRTRPIEETVGAMASWSRPARCATSGCPRRAPPRSAAPRRASDHRAADGVLAVHPRRRGRDPADHARARHRPRRLLAARPRLPDRHDHQRGSLPTRTDRAGRPYFPRFQGAALEANLGPWSTGSEIAAAKAARPGSSPSRWVLAQGEDVAPIPGTKRITYLEENVDAAA